MCTFCMILAAASLQLTNLKRKNTYTGLAERQRQRRSFNVCFDCSDIQKGGSSCIIRRIRCHHVKYIFDAYVWLILDPDIVLILLPEYAYFFFYSFVRTSYISRLTRKLPKGSKAPVLSTAAELIIGAVAGGLAQIFTIPVSVIATRQQVGRIINTKLPSNATDVSKPSDDSFMAVAREIVEEEGVGGLWLGIKPGLVLTVNPAITYGMYERVKSLLLLAKLKAGSNDKMSAGQSFIIGALSKTLATVVCLIHLPDPAHC